MACENVFWVNDIRQLVCDFSVIPTSDDTLAVTMNKVTRIALVLSLVVMCWSVKSGVVVLVLSFIFIISIFYGTKNAEKYSDVMFNTATSGRFCNDCDALAPNDPDYVSKNELLVGWGYPKTRIPPIVAPPSHDLGSWADSGLTRRNQINEQKTFDMYRSGFDTQDSYSAPRKCQECMYAPCMCAKYKDDVLTQTLQPGVYQKSLAGEPINSLIGVSYQQQFLPTLVEQTTDDIKFTQIPIDPTTCSAKQYGSQRPPLIEQPNKTDLSQNYSNIYDPRFTGYGSSDRTYVDPMTGQPRFFYSDVDSIKMPNYITRNNIDNLPWAPTYGPDRPIGGYMEHRQMANNAYHDSAVMFRTEMQERLMRKRNAEMWQRRVAPIYTGQQIGLGSIKSCMCCAPTVVYATLHKRLMGHYVTVELFQLLFSIVIFSRGQRVLPIEFFDRVLTNVRLYVFSIRFD